MNQKERERRILVAQIGRGNYQILDYAKADEKQKGVHGTRCTYGYSFEAVYDQFRQDVPLEKEDEWKDVILLVGTATSFWGSLCAYYRNREEALKQRKFPVSLETALGQVQDVLAAIYKNEEMKQKILIDPADSYGIKIDDIETEEMTQTVEQYLKEAASQNGMHVKFKILILEYGIHDGELQHNFGKLQDAIEHILEKGESETGIALDKVHLCFDISMGFRSLPMYIYTFASYLTRVRQETFQLHMYYGMADGRQKEAGQPDWCPLVNLQQIDVLMQWINVVNEFRRYGSVRGLTELFETHPDWNLRITRETDQGQRQTDFKHIFQRFDYATNSNNLKLLEESIDDVMAIKEALEKPEGASVPQEARLLLQDISVDFQTRFGRFHDVSYGQSYLTIRLAEWFYEQGHIGNAAIALQEGMITYALERYPEVFGEETIADVHDYDRVRKDKPGFFAQIGRAGDAVMQAFDLVRLKIRNVNSHILNESVTDQEISQNKEVLEDLLKYMVKEIESTTEPVRHPDGLPSLKEIFQIHQRKCDWNKKQKQDLKQYAHILYKDPSNGQVEKQVESSTLKDTSWIVPFETAIRELRATEKECVDDTMQKVMENPWLHAIWQIKEEADVQSGKKLGKGKKKDKKLASQIILNVVQDHTEKVLEIFERLVQETEMIE